jgi:hypothetical protein
LPEGPSAGPWRKKLGRKLAGRSIGWTLAQTFNANKDEVLFYYNQTPGELGMVPGRGRLQSGDEQSCPGVRKTGNQNYQFYPDVKPCTLSYILYKQGRGKTVY